MTLLDWMASVWGLRVNAPGGLGGECVDLVNLYLLQVWGQPPVRANAVDWQGMKLPDFVWTANLPDNAPPFGAIVVWGPNAAAGTGVEGHVAVALRSNRNHLFTLGQNWPTGSPVVVTHQMYAGVLGWHAPYAVRP